MKFRKFLLVLLAVLAVQSTFAQEEKKKSILDYLPEFHGTIRPRYEIELEDGLSRFQVRNARVSLAGKVSIVDYYVQADFCDKGKFKMLDAYVRFAMNKHFKVQAGQFRMPFSVDATRAPHLIYFANRSFIGKQIGNFRGVGVKVAYSMNKYPFNIEAGVFNTTAIGDHSVWRKEMTYSGKANYKFDNVKVEIGMQSIVPDSIRVNNHDISINWTSGRWMVEGEYVYKHYTNSDFDACHAYYVMADYKMPLKGFFNQLSFQGRWDAMTDHSDGSRNDDGLLYVTDQARKRITVGATLSHIVPKLKTDLRLNFEKYFYRDGAVAKIGDRDKLVLELVLRF